MIEQAASKIPVPPKFQCKQCGKLCTWEKIFCDKSKPVYYWSCDRCGKTWNELAE